MTTDGVFDLPFDEAVSFFRRKVNIPTARWTDLWRGEHAMGFMSAGAYQADLLTDLRSAVDQAVAGGLSKVEFRQRFREIVDRHGWQYNGGRNWRSDLIWGTNIETSYQAGRWRQFVEAGIKALRYHHADGVMHPRPLHVSWDGLVLPIGHPFWATHYPPNGWMCHCRAFAADGDGNGNTPPRGWDEIDPKTGAQVGIDKGWNYNVGAAAEQGYRVLAGKFERLPNDIARRWISEVVAGPAFELFVGGGISTDFPVAVLRPEDQAVIGARRQTVWMSAETMAKNRGELPTRSAGHPELTIDDYRLIPEIVDQGEVYQAGEERLIYLRRGDRTYRAALKRTADGSDNYFLSLFRPSDADRAMRLVGAKYERIR